MRTSPAVVSTCALAIALASGACGDDGQQPAADARIAADARAADAPMLPAGCDYAELRDTTNDDIAPATGTPEMTGLTFASTTVLCGTLDNTHYDGDITVDVDGYVITLAAEADVLITIAGPGAETLALVGVDVYTGPTLSQFVGSSTFYGNHGVTALHLTAGTYELAAFALDVAAPAAPIPYKVKIVTDTPATRCPAITTGGYAEALDGANHDGNDVLRIPDGAPPALTTAATDMPEPSTLVLEPGVNTRVTGSSADITTPDQYEDKDTFAFTTGATTNELAVRLDWPGTTANLDYLLFEATSTETLVRAITATNTAPEVRTFAIKPSTSYWLLVGAKAGSTLPVTYAASLCGAAFIP